MKKNILIHFLVLIGVPVAGLLLLLLVHLIPVERMQKNVAWSMDMLEAEFTDELVIDGFRSTLTGNFTDSLMLEHSIYKNKSYTMLNQTLMMHRPESFYNPEDPDGWQPGESLRDYLNGVTQPREVDYSRYWHGYLIVLKPLLFFMTVNSIRMVNSVLELSLLGLVLVLLGKKNQHGLAFAFMAAMPFMYFTTTFASLNQSICMYLMLIAVSIYLWKAETFENTGKRFIFFLVLGMLTSYFDFLTYPLVVLAFPLCVSVTLLNENVGKKILNILTLSIEWTVGYFWMWATKWIFADVFTGSSTIKNALSTIVERTGEASESNRFSGALKVFLLNLKPFMNLGYVFLTVLVVLVLIVMIIKNRNIKAHLANSLPYIVIALYPFAWWFALENHSEQHWVFTCRIFAITVFALVAGVMSIFVRKEDNV